MTVLAEVTDVSHHYGNGPARTRILDAVSLTVHPSQVLALLGRSGSGKSTLCHLLGGVNAPDEGSITLEGEHVGNIRDWTRISLCPQRVGLAQEFSIAENVFLPCSVRDRAPVPGLLEALALDTLTARAARETSLGEQQRAGIARALVTAPALAILDEPTGHQDDRNAERVAAAIELAQSHGTAVILATHDERVLNRIDALVRLEGGRLHRSPQRQTPT